jgi:hypothetical protein
MNKDGKHPEKFLENLLRYLPKWEDSDYSVDVNERLSDTNPQPLTATYSLVGVFLGVLYTVEIKAKTAFLYSDPEDGRVEYGDRILSVRIYYKYNRPSTTLPRGFGFTDVPLQLSEDFSRSLCMDLARAIVAIETSKEDRQKVFEGLFKDLQQKLGYNG